MTLNDFNTIVDSLLDTTKNTLIRKTDEYNLDVDRLSCFKRAAAIQQVTSAQALLGMMTKHIVSIYDIVESDTWVTEAMAKEKIGDAINYLCLLYAVLAETGFKVDPNKVISCEDKSN